jgi:hypothetical protein
MVYKKVSFGLGDDAPKALWDETELQYDSDDGDYDVDAADPETWQDWNSEWLLDNYMAIRDAYETRYLRVPFSFNHYCEIMYANK